MAVTSEAVGGLVANVVLLVLSTIVVGLRFAARAKNKASYKLDDWIIVLSLACAAGIGISSIWAYCAEVKGVLFESMTYEVYVAYRKVLFTDILIAHLVYGLVKLSVIFFYKRIFSAFPLFRLASNVLIVVILAWMLSAFLSLLFSTKPIHKFWTQSPTQDSSSTFYVIDFPAALTAHAVIDIILDVAILILPLRVIGSLNLTLKKKITVAGIFMLGGFCLVCSIVRLTYTHALLDYAGADGMKRLKLSDNNDMWAHIEAFASIITACLPTLGPVFRGLRPLDAIIGSLRSVFTLRSRSNGSENESRFQAVHSAPKPASKSEKRAWYELTTKGSTVSQGTEYDVERGSQSSRVIMVKDTFSVRSGETGT